MKRIYNAPPYYSYVKTVIQNIDKCTTQKKEKLNKTNWNERNEKVEK